MRPPHTLTPAPRRWHLAGSAAVAALLALGAHGAALAQAWPDKPLKVVVGFPPGGAADQIARLVSTPLAAALGQPVVVENRAGAGGNIGADLVAKAPGAQEMLGLGLTAAMVRYAARSEWAVTVEDMLARRWRVLFLDARLAAQMAPRVAELLEQETGIDPALPAFLALCQQYQLSPSDLAGT